MQIVVSRRGVWSPSWSVVSRREVWSLVLECGLSSWSVVSRRGVWSLVLECGLSSWSVVSRRGVWSLVVECGLSSWSVVSRRGVSSLVVECRLSPNFSVFGSISSEVRKQYCARVQLPGLIYMSLGAAGPQDRHTSNLTAEPLLNYREKNWTP